MVREYVSLGNCVRGWRYVKSSDQLGGWEGEPEACNLMDGVRAVG